MFRKSIVAAMILGGLFVLAGTSETTDVALKELLSKPQDYLGKTISTTGTVEHVCKHGGKKMLIFADTPEQSIHVMASEKVPVFNAEANGSNVHVIGVVKENRITRAQVLKMIDEQKAAEQKGNSRPSMSSGEGFGHGQGVEKPEAEATCSTEHPLLQEMKTTGKDYVSQYFVECIEYKVK